jgi:hypothetical protein
MGRSCFANMSSPSEVGNCILAVISRAREGIFLDGDAVTLVTCGMSFAFAMFILWASFIRHRV